MPKRKTTTVREHGSVTPREIEQLREAIAQGFPWVSNHVDNMYRQSGLPARLDILLSYVTGLGCLSIFGSGYDHPSKQTVKAVKAELQSDIDAAEKRYASVCVGERFSDADFRQQFPHEMPRGEY